MTSIIVIALAGAVSSFCITPIVRVLALHLGLTDKPDGYRKTQEHPIALGGGLAVLLGMLVAVLVAFYFPNPLQKLLHAKIVPMIGLLVATLIVCLAGLADDWIGLRGRQKLFAQLLAALVLLLVYRPIQKIEMFGQVVDLGIIAVPFTLFWILGAINAINLMDGIDGLASSLGAVMAVAIAAMAFYTNHLAEAAVAIALFGALVGFLPSNFPPAKIYLGDAGSMVIGLVVGALAIQASIKGAATVAIAAPLAVWSIPVFDSAMAILRRKLTGRSIYETDRSHLHHCLSNKVSSLWTLVVIVVLCLLTTAGALASVWLHNESLAVIGMLAVVSILVISGIFGRAEAVMVANRLRSLGQSLVTSPRKRSDKQNKASTLSVRIQGSKDWGELWDWLIEAALPLDVQGIELDVNVPMIHEAYHAKWRHADHNEENLCWHLTIPIVNESGRRLGRFEFIGKRHYGPMSTHWEPLAELFETLEFRIGEIMDPVLPDKKVTETIRSNQPETVEIAAGTNA